MTIFKLLRIKPFPKADPLFSFIPWLFPHALHAIVFHSLGLSLFLESDYQVAFDVSLSARSALGRG
jgi:hypothetical protein